MYVLQEVDNASAMYRYNIRALHLYFSRPTPFLLYFELRLY